jgi:tight adherence protein C
MRIKRLLKAEEKAHMLPVKMTVPLILGILPPLVIVILAPAIIRFMRVSGSG